MFGSIESVVQILNGVGLGEFLVLNQVWPMFVNEGVEGQAVAPAAGEVANVDIFVAGSLHLAP